MHRAAYALLAAAAILFIFAIAKSTAAVSDHADNHLRLLIISISIALPELVIWYIAVRSGLSFKRYASGIKKSRDGQGLNDIATALLLLAVYVTLLTMASSIEGLFRQSSLLKAVVIIGNHLPLLVVLTSSIMLYKGARRLNTLVPLQITTNYLLWLPIVCVIAFGGFAWDFYRTVPALAPAYGVPRFAMARQTLLFSYVFPYILAWILGLVSCVTIANYARHTKGSIYKVLLSDLYRGILLVYACAFLAQLFIASNVRLDHFSLLIVLIYLLLVAATFGYGLVYRGSKKLQKLENV